MTAFFFRRFQGVRRGSSLIIAGLGIFFTSCAAFFASDGGLLFSTLDHLIQDAFIHHIPRGEVEPSTAMVVDVDNNTLSVVGQWPWPRYRLGALVGILAEQEPAVIGLDFLFPEPDRTSLNTIQEAFFREFGLDIGFTGLPPGLENNDAYFGQMLSQTETVSGLFMFFDQYNKGYECQPPFLEVEGDLDALSLVEATGILCNTPSIQQALLACGFLNTGLDKDGVLRKLHLLLAYKGHIYPNLTITTLMQSLGVKKLRIETDFLGPVLVIGSVRLPVDHMGRALIGFNAKNPTPKRVSALDVLRGEVVPESMKDRIVFVGSSAAGLNDMHKTPISPLYPGVAIHAVLTDNALHGTMLRTPVWSGTYAVLTTLLTGLAVLVFFLAGTPGWAAVGTASLGLAFFLLDLLLYVWAGVLLPMAGPLFTALVLLMGLSVSLYSRERRLALQRLQMISKARQTILEAMTAVAETRDPETGGHIKRTQSYVKVLAECLASSGEYPDLTPSFIEVLHDSSPLHDVGKVGVPDAILMKPGKLTDDEFMEMKKHTVYGHDILENAGQGQGDNNFFQVAKDIAYSHHEKWDGSGYPQGLSGTDIPLAGRIMALADVYDALISKRHYKPSFSHEKSRAIILSSEGTHFDPALIAAFCASEQQFINIAHTFQDSDQAD